MSEEKPRVAEEQLIVSTTRAGAEVWVRFADGEKMVPDYVVAKLGGVEAVEATAGQFSSVTFADFMGFYNRAQQRETLNRIGATFVRGALGRGR